MTKVQFSEEAYKKIDELMKRFPEGKHKSALIETLFIAQKESGGWLSSAVMDHVAEIMGLLPVEVYEVATFYTMFNLEPVGKHVFPCLSNRSLYGSRFRQYHRIHTEKIKH